MEVCQKFTAKISKKKTQHKYSMRSQDTKTVEKAFRREDGMKQKKKWNMF